jgi:hypothetical protein
MLINRHNYEEFFLLYVDNELPVADRKAVEAFVEQNPDLEEELVMMMQSVLRPDQKIVFTNKESLLKGKAANGLVNENNYEEYFVLYGDNELNNEEKDLVEQFVYKHPQYQAEFELIQRARLIPEQGIIYPDKNELYRTEDDDRVIPFRWWRIAAAAIVLLFLGVAVWYMANNRNSTGNADDGGIVKNQNDSSKQNKAAIDNNQVAVKEDKQPAPVIKEEKPAVTDVRENIAVVNKENKSGKERNIERTGNVTPKRTDIEKGLALKQETPLKQEETQPEHVESKVVVKPAIIEAVQNSDSNFKTGFAAVGKEPGSALNKEEKTVYYYIDDNSSEDDIKLANASINKKPVRGLIRKVKGLFEGSNDDNEQPEQEKKKGIRIAAFSIALK